MAVVRLACVYNGRGSLRGVRSGTAEEVWRLPVPDASTFTGTPVPAPQPAPAPPPTPAPPPPAQSDVQAVISFARAQLGERYVWGAAGPDSWDCSGLTMQAWASAGVYLPHYSVAQYAATTPVAVRDLRPGDLVFWASNSSDRPSASGSPQAPGSAAKRFSRNVITVRTSKRTTGLRSSRGEPILGHPSSGDRRSYSPAATI